MTFDPIALLQLAAEEINKKERDLDKIEGILNNLLSFSNEDKILPDILTNLATAHMLKGNYGLAIHLYKQASQSTENDKIKGLCYNNIGICERKKSFIIDDESIVESAKYNFKEAHKLLGDADSLVNLGCMSIAANDSQNATEIFNKALEIVPDHPNARWNRGLAYLEQGNFKKGWQDYEHGARTDNRRKRSYNGLPDWDGTNESTIIVYGEQGIGDEIMWASMIPDIAENNTIIFDCHPRLQDLFRDAFPQVRVYGTRKERECYWPKYCSVNYSIALGSLGKFFRNNLEDFPKTPFLKADPLISEKYKNKLSELSSRKKIGISWRGGTTETGELFRKIDLNHWVDLFKEDFDFISLQYRPDAERDIEEFNKEHPDYKIHHWRDTLDDYDETAGLIDNLDLIISIPQSVVHLAGAMGVKTIQLTPIKSLWQMGVYGQDMPWYNCVKSIWQTKHGEWEDVMIKAKDQLCSL